MKTRRKGKAKRVDDKERREWMGVEKRMQGNV